MSEIEIKITNEDVEAVTDPAVCEVADIIVLRNQGCGNASVLIDRLVRSVRTQARAEAIEEAAGAVEGAADALHMEAMSFQKDGDQWAAIMASMQCHGARAAFRAIRTLSTTP